MTVCKRSSNEKGNGVGKKIRKELISKVSTKGEKARQEDYNKCR